MTRKQALRHAAEITRRLNAVNGIVWTRKASHDATVVRCVWVRGSTARGSECPDDADILVDW